MITKSLLTTDEIWKSFLYMYKGDVTYIGPYKKRQIVVEFCRHFIYVDAPYVTPFRETTYYFGYFLDGKDYDKAIKQRGIYNKLVSSLSSGSIVGTLVPFDRLIKFKEQLLSIGEFVGICCVYNNECACIAAVKV